jgi:thymidylate synthase
MKQYKEMIKTILETGEVSTDRTGVGTIRIPGYSMKFDLSDGSVPIVTGKRTAYRTAIKELLWFINGEQNLKTLLEQNVHIWTEWKFKRYIEGKCPENEKYTGPVFPDNWTVLKDKDEEFAKLYREQLDIFEQKILNDEITSRELTVYEDIYGNAWKYNKHVEMNNMNTQEQEVVVNIVDQLDITQKLIKSKSDSRRIILNSWNTASVPYVDLPPCVFSIQFLVINDKLHMIVNQRSADSILGVPFDLAEYGIFLHMMGAISGLQVGTMTYNFGDTHIYQNHIDQAKEYLSRELYDLPKIEFTKDLLGEDIRNIKLEDIKINGYKCGDAIKASVAI